MFKRKILDEINKWKNSLNIKKRALVIKGLRQIGKTTVVLNYCKKNYENFVFINKALVCTGDLINPLFIGFFSKDLTKSDHFMR